MNRAKFCNDLLKFGAGTLLVASLTGCVGYVDGGGAVGYVAPVFVPVPEVYIYGGGYERGHDVHIYSERGHESRGFAHPGGGGHEGKRR